MDQEKSKISFRTATRSDISSLVWCSNFSVADDERQGFGSPRDQRKFGNIQNLSDSRDAIFKNNEILIAQRDEKVIGYAVIEFLNDSLELEDIAVAGHYQGKGIGKKIVHHVEGYALSRGKNLITLGTKRNATGTPWKSLGWCKDLGFEITREEHNEWTKTFSGSEIRLAKKVGNSSSSSTQAK